MRAMLAKPRSFSEQRGGTPRPRGPRLAARAARCALGLKCVLAKCAPRAAESAPCTGQDANDTCDFLEPTDDECIGSGMACTTDATRRLSCRAGRFQLDKACGA